MFWSPVISESWALNSGGLSFFLLICSDKFFFTFVVKHIQCCIIFWWSFGWICIALGSICVTHFLGNCTLTWCFPLKNIVVQTLHLPCMREIQISFLTEIWSVVVRMLQKALTLPLKIQLPNRGNKKGGGGERVKAFLISKSKIFCSTVSPRKGCGLKKKKKKSTLSL